MRRALVIGIDKYDNYPHASLKGCANDARRVAEILSRHYDGSPNFSCQCLLSPPNNVMRSVLRKNIELLFQDAPEVALFYFSGHGTINNLGGYLVTQDAKSYDEGVAMTDVLTYANQSKAREVVIIIDSCHSGAFGKLPAINNEAAILREGVSVLTASRESQAAVEIGGEGLFTSLVCDALEGGAADVVGDVTVAGIYSYVDQALGPWDQRPLFKSHVSKLLKVRRAEGAIEPSVLRLLPTIFKSPSDEFKLDPSYEPTAEPRNKDNEKVFRYLQQYNRAGLVIPVEEKDMYYAAMNSRTCKLTRCGQFYWRVVTSNKI
jgi:hypothetical protein